MHEDQKFIEEIGRLMWSIMPEEAAEMIFCGRIYDYVEQGGADWIKHDGTVGYFPFGRRPDEVEDAIRRLARALRETPRFQKEPWTHYKVTIKEQGGLRMEFGYIPEEDSWPGLFLRRVSELSGEEADQFNIPKKDWERAKRLAAENAQKKKNNAPEQDASI